jgi:seryl-tRNA synthetase
MLDINVLREDAAPVIDSIKRRGQQEKLPLIKEALRLDEEWRKAKGAADEKRAERNKLSEAINKTKKAGEDPAPIIKKAKELPEAINKLEAKERELREKLDSLLQTLPSPLHPEVPQGASADDNIQRGVYGDKPSFDFKPQNHAELAEKLGVADFEASRRTSGSGFYFLKGDLALLDVALQRYALDVMLKEGFTPVVPPYMTRHRIAAGMTDLAWFDETMYKVEKEDLYLIPTAEFPLVGMLVDQEVDERDLPVKLCGISPCFRKEIGAHGVDEKGLWRTHQFHKIEQVVLCKPEESRKWFDKLMSITTELFTGLGLHVRHLEMCAGDLGDLKERQYDVEAWRPRTQEFGEVGSCSNLTDFQARRLNIRAVTPSGERYHVHTLNNTALATSRAMVAILENHQQADGTVKIPEKLVPYMNGKTVIQKA